MKFIVEQLPNLLYLAGSVAFVAGTVLNMIRGGA
jgi:hypothetical protein